MMNCWAFDIPIPANINIVLPQSARPILLLNNTITIRRLYKVKIFKEKKGYTYIQFNSNKIINDVRKCNSTTNFTLP